MDTNKDWKIQYSNSDGNGGIMVERFATEAEAELGKMWVDKVMGKTHESAPQVTVGTSTPVIVTAPTGLFCKKHNAPMRLNKNGKPYHMDRTRPEGDMFCNGRGYPSEFAGKSSEQIGKELSEEDFSL